MGTQHPEYGSPVEQEHTLKPVDLGTALAAARATPIDDLGLPVRIRNCLWWNGIHTIGHLAEMTEYNLRSFRNLGEKSVAEVQDALLRRGLRLSLGPSALDLSQAARGMVAAVRDDGLRLPPRSRRALRQLVIALATAGRLAPFDEAPR